MIRNPVIDHRKLYTGNQLIRPWPISSTVTVFYMVWLLMKSNREFSKKKNNKRQFSASCSVHHQTFTQTHTHMLLCTFPPNYCVSPFTSPLHPLPSPLHSLLRLVGSSRYKLLFIPPIKLHHPLCLLLPPLKPLHLSFSFCFCLKASDTWKTTHTTPYYKIK